MDPNLFPPDETSALMGTTPDCPEEIVNYVRDFIQLGKEARDLLPRLVAFPVEKLRFYRSNWTKYYGIKYFQINGETWGLYRGPAEPQPPSPTQVQPAPEPEPEQ